MKAKKLIIGGLVSLLVVLMGVFALVPINGIKVNEPDLWMKNLQDERLITQTSIPGSHDTGAPHSFFDVAGKCQDLNVREQLAIGVRFLDARLQMSNDRFIVVHSFVKQNLTFESFLKDAVAFIKANPSEFLLFSIKEEADPVNSSKDFETLVKEYLDPYKSVISYSQSLPLTVGEARGKIHLISRYKNSTIGVPAYSGWKDDTSFELEKLIVQDNYKIENPSIKIEDIKKMMEISKNQTQKLVLNYTSCYLLDAFPPTYAGTIAVDIHAWLNEELVKNKDCVGVLVCDFITAELAKNIYGRNF